jgi:uncharacterized protein (DUF983 family)
METGAVPRAVSPVGAALRGRCPACGGGRLFIGYLAMAPRCEVCDEDLSETDPGDGPRAFAILIGGALIMVGVVTVEVRFHPPYWVHAVIWVPTITVVLLGLVRLLKALMIGLQFKFKAREGRISDS